jgi:hypothetical protein
MGNPDNDLPILISTCSRKVRVGGFEPPALTLEGEPDQAARCDLFDWGSFPSLARSNAAPHRTLFFVLILPKTLEVSASL